MDEELLYSNLVLTMKFLNNKQQSKPDKKSFYHANLVLTHFLECKNMFAQTTQVQKALLNYYQQRWVLKDEVDVDDTDSLTFMNEMRKENQINTNVCQFVVKLLIVGLNSLMSKDIEKHVAKQMKQVYNQLKQALIFESQSPTDVLKPFVQKLTKQIKSFQFYESLLKIFKQIESFSIVRLLQKTISDFREQWTKNQQQMKENFTQKKKNRQNALIPSPKRIGSLAKNQKENENNQVKENNRQAYKTAEKKPEITKTNLKSLKMIKQKPFNPRQSFHHGKNYQFNPRASTSNFDSSMQSVSFDDMKFSSQPSCRMNFQAGKGRQKLEEIDEDCLCQATPDKLKKTKK